MDDSCLMSIPQSRERRRRKTCPINWGLIRCPPAVAVQKFLNRKGSSLSVIMGTNDYDMNFLVGNDLGNAVYNQWLKHTLSEEQWNRAFDHDAVEVCLATLYLATLYSGFGGIHSRTTLDWNTPSGRLLYLLAVSPQWDRSVRIYLPQCCRR